MNADRAKVIRLTRNPAYEPKRFSGDPRCLAQSWAIKGRAFHGHRGRFARVGVHPSTFVEFARRHATVFRGASTLS
jgi:hypothetical protein